jgi:3-oxoacyl-[acyl-carrier protein] reductase
MDITCNDVIMISGGSKGIGFAISERLGLLGARISICGRDESALDQARQALADKGVDVLSARADVSSVDDVEQWYEKTESRFGPVSILIPNAGISGYGNLADLTEEQFDQTMATNVRGVFLCVKRGLPAMTRQRRGKIIIISSIASKYFRHGHSLYFATKWALNGFAFSVAKEVNEYNVHVHVLCPGMVETEFFTSAGGRPHEASLPYIEPSLIAELTERLITLPDTVDTLDWAVFPHWQQPSLGIRR